MNAAVRAARPAAARHAGRGTPARAANSDTPAKTRRPDRRAARTVEKIIAAAQEAMVDLGAAKLSVREVCEKAGVSRGTLYRYFSSMDDVLQAVALRLRTETDEELHAALEPHADPTDRFTAFLNYTGASRETERMAHFLHAEPEFVLRYFESNFAHFIERVNVALKEVYEAWEQTLGQPLDREAISETMVRFALSETLIPTPPGATPLPARLRAMVDMVLLELGVTRR